MLWIVTCVDNPNTAAIRESVLQPHRDYLGSQKKILVLAGATQSDDGKTAIGSHFVLNVNSRALELAGVGQQRARLADEVQRQFQFAL